VGLKATGHERSSSIFFYFSMGGWAQRSQANRDIFATVTLILSHQKIKIIKLDLSYGKLYD
jgi:hypothetical protein